MAQRLQDELSAFFFEYDTPRMVLVRNKKVGVVFRLIQFVVLVYVIGWVFVYEKGYQTSSGLISSVSVKLKGLAVTQLPGLGPQVWDVADYVFPAQGDSSFVIMTNFIATPRQAQGYCAEVSAQASVWPSTTLCRHVRSLAGVPWRWTTTSHGNALSIQGARSRFPNPDRGASGSSSGNDLSCLLPTPPLPHLYGPSQ
uniref:Purinergic receptor P2X 1 n=1 Tax=Felis catus TaxID=9685 RepID=A0ABI7ZM99_FELCA